MLSHAQNFEDVMLYRALKHIARGTYIDVGAWHPQLHSVTKWFYDCGWCGVNVEPSRKFFGLLRSRRPRDTNLNVALGREPAQLQFFEASYSGLSSMDRNAVDLARKFGFMKSRSYSVDVSTMAQVFEEHISGDVHFVKIDVEGFESDVLAGFDWVRNRPWIIVVEAVRPTSTEPTWSQWEGTLVAAGYEFVWFDGLNRFYLRHESRDLRVQFQLPVNLYDEVAIPWLDNKISTWELRIRTYWD